MFLKEDNIVKDITNMFAKAKVFYGENEVEKPSHLELEPVIIDTPIESHSVKSINDFMPGFCVDNVDDSEENPKRFTNEVLGISIRVMQAEDGSILINAEDAARSVNLVYLNKIDQNGKHPVRWIRLNEYLEKADCNITVDQGDYIPEAVYYILVMNSQSNLGKKVKTWLAKEVIPTVRKHGAYMTTKTLEKAISNPDFMIGLLENLKNEQEKNKILQDTIKEQAPKIEYHDKVLNPSGLITSTEIASDLGMSTIDFHKRLHYKKVIYKVNKTWIVYSKYKRLINTHYDYTIGSGQTLRWTELGREWLLRDIFKIFD